MTSRERWLACLKGERPDRVPAGYWATEEVAARLLRELNLPGQEALYRRLGIDRPAHAGPRYVGPPLQKGESHWGYRTAPLSYPSGVYWEVCHNFQPVTPTANVLALYEAAHAYGPPPRAAMAALERKTP